MTIVVLFCKMSAKKTFDELITTSDIPVLVDFWAEWCNPCLMMAPALQEFAEKYSDKLKVVKINIEKNQAVSERFSIQSIPTLILFKNGEVLWRKSGALSFSQLKNELQFFL